MEGKKVKICITDETQHQVNVGDIGKVVTETHQHILVRFSFGNLWFNKDQVKLV